MSALSGNDQYLAVVIDLKSRKVIGWSMRDTLEQTLVHRERYLTREQAKASLFDYIEVFYNRKRRHSALGYQSPLDFEQSLLN